MIIDRPFQEHPDLPAGPVFLKLIGSVAARLQQRSDHFPLFIMGDTNSGKSSLLLTIYDKFFVNAHVENLAFSRDEFARIQARVAQGPHPRFVGYDEADIESKEAMSRWNRDVNRLFDNTRHSQILWVLCNPSVRGLDKTFIEDEIIKGLIIIMDKSKRRPRQIAYYRKQDLLRMVDKKIPLTLRHLTKKMTLRRFAFLVSWFREYNGRLWEEYMEKKNKRVVELHEDFGNSWGKGSMTQPAAAAELGVSVKTIRRYSDQAFKEGKLNRSQIVSASGKWGFSHDDLGVLKEMLSSMRQKMRDAPSQSGLTGTGPISTREEEKNEG